MLNIGRFPYPTQSFSGDNLRSLSNMAEELRDGWDFPGVDPLRWGREEQVSFLQSIFDGVPPGLVLFWKEERKEGRDVRRVLDGRERVNTFLNMVNGDVPFLLDIQTGKVSLDTEPSLYNIPLHQLFLRQSFQIQPLQDAGLSDETVVDMHFLQLSIHSFLHSFVFPTTTVNQISLEQALHIRDLHNLHRR